MRLAQPQWALAAPRRWQAETYPILARHLDQSSPEPSLIQAVMGSGKSILAAELVAGVLDSAGTVVVSTPTVALVDQLAETIEARLTAEGRPAGTVGRFYTHAKDADRPVIVTCVPSAPALAQEMRRNGRNCGFLLADEAHRTEAAGMRTACADLSPEGIVGFSATPFRARADEALSIFKRELYRYGPAEALRDGVIVPWDVVDWTGGQVLLDDACTRMIKAAKGPGIVNATSIRDAESFSRKLRTAGVRAKAVHSGMSRAEVEKRLKLLECGDLHCLVHVSLLQEGVNLPWLRWLCLRRNVSSRVRFAQEVGRVLRSCAGKERATLLDPLDLCSSFRLSYEAALGWECPYYAAAAKGDTEAAELGELAREIMIGAAHGHGLPAACLSKVESKLKGYVLQFDRAGLLDTSELWPAGTWRRRPAHPLQLAQITKRKSLLSYPIAPPLVRKFLQTVAKNMHTLTRGGAADLLTLVVALDQHRRWPEDNPAEANQETAAA